MTVWALSPADVFSELRAELCAQSHALLLILDAACTCVSSYLQALQRLLQSALTSVKPSRQPALFLVAAVCQSQDYFLPHLAHGFNFKTLVSIKSVGRLSTAWDILLNCC